MSSNWITIGTVLIGAQVVGVSALAQEKSTAYRVQLSEISVQSPRSRRTDTDYAAISVQLGDTAARTVTRRIGDVGRGTKAINLSLSKVAVTPQGRLRVNWAIVNYGGERHAVLMQVLGKAIEGQTQENWMAQLSQGLSDVLEARKGSCDGPVSAASFEITGAELSRQLRSGKPFRITRRQRGMEAPSRCQAKSDYSVTVVIFKEP